MAEKFHDGGKTYAGTEHLCGICVPKLVRHDAHGESKGMTDLVEVVSQLAYQCFFCVWSRQQQAVGGEQIKGTKEAKTVDQLADKRIDWNHSFGLQLAQWDMDCPLIRTRRMEAVIGQIGTFADSHAGMTDEEKGICSQVVAA